MAEQDERAAFEVWAKSRFLDCSVSADAWGKPVYLHPHIESMFSGWYAARDAISTQAQPAAGEAAPVAWRFETHGPGRPHDPLVRFTDNIEKLKQMPVGVPVANVTPLYTHPAANDQRDAALSDEQLDGIYAKARAEAAVTFGFGAEVTAMNTDVAGHSAWRRWLMRAAIESDRTAQAPGGAA